MTKEKQCAMDKRGTISIKLTPEELKMLKHFLNVTLGSVTIYKAKPWGLRSKRCP